MCLSKHKSFFLFILLSLFRFAALADDGVLFSSFFAEKNLSSQSITCFLQDSKGHMWIGTADGLNYFNGKTIKIFKHNYQDSTSLKDNLILSLCEDRAGNIWVGTSWGISRLDPTTLLFENYDKDSKGLGLGYKVTAYVDKEDNVWALCWDLYKLNKTSGQFEKKIFKARAKETIRPPKLYSGLFEDSKKRYWLSCNDYVYRYFPKENVCEPVKGPVEKPFFLQVGEDRQGNLFCGSWNGFFRVNAASNTLEQVEEGRVHGCFALQQLNGSSVLWYGNALSDYNLANGSVKHYQHDINDPYSCRNGEVTALLVDAQNQLWIGYETKGIQIVSPSNQVFKTYRLSTPQDNFFPNPHCFIRTQKSAYVGGWYSHALGRLDSNYQLVKTWKNLVPQVTQTENNISDAWADKHGNLWLSSCYGLICFNENSEKAQLFTMDSSLCKNNFFLQMLPEGDSVLWLAGYFSGLTRFSVKTKTFRNWGGKEHVLFWGITRDNQGMIWLANNSGVLTGFDPKRCTFVTKTYTPLTENAIYSSILYDSTGNALWIATTNGLLKVDRKTFAGKLFTEKDNLPTCQVNALQFDTGHRLWIATNKGLCLYDPKENVFKTFFSNNGLPTNMLDKLFKMQPGGRLLIGSRNGLSVLNTGAIPAESYTQTVAIDKIYEGSHIVPVALVKGRKTIELGHDQDNIRIEFSSNDLISSEDNQLLFRLEGFDNNWYIAQNGVVNYSKLAPGKYLLHVSGIGHSGLRLRRDDYLAILIHPPFWKTAWFIALLAFVLFSLTVLVARYVFTRNLREKILILEKEQAIEKERSRISQDMHDELGSGLTKISIMSEVAMKQLDNTAKAKTQLETISASSRELVDNLQDIIWILNSRNDSLENLCAYLQEYALKYFEAFDMEVKVEFPELLPAIKLSEDQRRNILLVFKESFNNISKHSACSRICLSMALEDNTVSFVITDNGRGFDKTTIRSFANGLLSIKKRMSSINGSFSISSAAGQGTTSSFAFKV